MVDEWAETANTFAIDHYLSLHGRVRTHVIQETLRTHLPTAPAALIDVGGGAGNQSIPLARRGYEVTLVDSSRAMLGHAETALVNEAHEVADRVHLVEGRGEDAPRLLGTKFDIVLCHGVVMYLEDSTSLLASLAELARPGGVVSIVAKAPASVVTLAALEGRWADARHGFDQRQTRNRLGFMTRTHSVDEVTQAMAALGVDMEAWYGVRLFTDGWGDDDVDEATAADIMAVELEAARRDPYRSMSRLFHWVGRNRITPAS